MQLDSPLPLHSNWEAPRLSESQVKYAALDAIAGREIYLELRRRGQLPADGGLEGMITKWLLSGDESDWRRARSLAVERDSLRRLYKLGTGQSCFDRAQPIVRETADGSNPLLMAATATATAAAAAASSSFGTAAAAAAVEGVAAASGAVGSIVVEAEAKQEEDRDRDEEQETEEEGKEAAGGVEGGLLAAEGSVVSKETTAAFSGPMPALEGIMRVLSMLGGEDKGGPSATTTSTEASGGKGPRV